MSGTPKTDAAWFPALTPIGTVQAVRIEFAQNLERNGNTLAEALKQLQDRYYGAPYSEMDHDKAAAALTAWEELE